jgi:hypothetical protein
MCDNLPMGVEIQRVACRYSISRAVDRPQHMCGIELVTSIVHEVKTVRRKPKIHEPAQWRCCQAFLSPTHGFAA